ncbi:Midasin [Bienertia sinuspersici]
MDSNGLLVYIGRDFRTFAVDADELSWFELVDLAKKCGGYNKIESIQYLLPRMSFESGLRNVYSDSEVREMVDIAYENRLLDLYVVHGVDEPEVLNDLGPIIHEPLSPKCTPSQKTNRKKLTPKKAPQAINKCPRQQKDSVSLTPNYSHVPNKVVSTSDFNSPQIDQDSPVKATDNPNFFIPTQSSQPLAKNTSSKPVPEDYDWEDPRPDSPLRWQDLIFGDEVSDGDESDPDYMLENDSELEEDGETEDDLDDLDVGQVEHQEEVQDEVEEDDGADSSDDELRIAREKVKASEAKLIELAQQLQREAEEGRLGKKQETNQGKGQPQNEENQDEGIVSEYEDSGDEIHTPASSDEEDTVGARRERRGDLVHADTDFSSFVWKVGQRFPTRDDFKESVKKYSVHQGRNLGFVVSNRNKNNRVGVNCLKGCPFKLYGSWDTRRGTFVLKSVVGEHTCSRNMERNKQLKSSWVASQLLELFKARPHIPAKEIQELIRRGFRCVVKKGFAYKVKYYAHQQLHGSMKAHYNKLGNYIQAIKECSPNTVTELVTDSSKRFCLPSSKDFLWGLRGYKRGGLRAAER